MVCTKHKSENNKNEAQLDNKGGAQMSFRRSVFFRHGHSAIICATFPNLAYVDCQQQNLIQACTELIVSLAHKGYDCFSTYTIMRQHRPYHALFLHIYVLSTAYVSHGHIHGTQMGKVLQLDGSP